MLKKSAFYLVAALIIFSGQFLASSGLLTGYPPPITHATLTGEKAMARIGQGPALLYFWAEWCGICRGMQGNINAVLQDYPGLSVAVRSGDDKQVAAYLRQHELAWPVVNDNEGTIGQQYGVRGVPALFFIDRRGRILFASAGYTSEWGLRIRLWLTGLF